VRWEFRIFSFYVTHSLTEQSPSWEANSYPATQQIPHQLWNAKVHYRVNNSPSLVPVLNEMNPFHAFASYFTKIHFNIILPSALRSSERPSSSDFHTKTLCTFPISPCVLDDPPTSDHGLKQLSLLWQRVLSPVTAHNHSFRCSPAAFTRPFCLLVIDLLQH
jgi:hypothetical protein